MLPNLTDIPEIVKGQAQGRLPALTPREACTDSRLVHPGALFLALPGERFDGHDFVRAALDQGAVAALVSRIPPDLPPGAPLILVEDTLVAYGQLGAWARQQSSARILALTGSAGKTTTKRLLGELLSQQGPTLVAPGTENNEIGVPRALLDLGPQHRYAVLEFGMRGPGEIAYLARLTSPEVGVITNIGSSHVGRLGGREAIAKCKAELLPALPPSGHALLNRDDFFFGLLQELARCPVVSFGLSPEAEVRAEEIVNLALEGSRFTLCLGEERLPIELPLPGMHNVLNALAASAAYWVITGSTQGLREGLACASGEPMRNEILRLPGSVTVINDAYNASPPSVAAALALLSSIAGRKVFVFGDMLELGQFAESEHREVGRLAAQGGVSWLVAVGENAALTAATAAEAGVATTIVTSPEEAASALREGLQRGDVVLVKASRRMGLEQVVEGLRHAD
ncbi:MAG: UDP-N-acetylmuramoyl-tripeptide--D-alanyl-D-alanine ligase [candidate division WS1 bacterium]|jgi:UDP-N-acetylmuramoyl-tripeptide--D-alanyl-D-alanine ligase|nr:UDP-N-acetylmuramoyl-tripeptide--D-alanyl-D-alanine ligase [candidate division WS1 bacterium]